MDKILYTIEYKKLIVFDYEHNRDSIYESLYEAKKLKHIIYHFYKEHFNEFKNIKFKDFKIRKYVLEMEKNEDDEC